MRVTTVVSAHLYGFVQQEKRGRIGVLRLAGSILRFELAGDPVPEELTRASHEVVFVGQRETGSFSGQGVACGGR